MAEDTIIAVSTATGYAPRAVVRLSGADAVPAVGQRFRPDEGLTRPWHRTFTVTPGTVTLSRDGLSAPATTYVMRAPCSYTREDVVELHLSGSPALLDMVLDEFLSAGSDGIRLAEPGEFTRRAFLNGRIDLAQAEAVLAVVRARNEAELLAASARLEGAASREVGALQERLAALRAQVEAALDFGEGDIELVSPEEFLGRCNEMIEDLREEVATSRSELASDGTIRVAIFGPPNAGKSSILNRLAREERAIVHDTPGTTRDPVSTEIELNGVYFTITDTAGFRSADATVEHVERSAMSMTEKQIHSSQLVLLVLDGSAGLPEDVLGLLGVVPPERLLCVINKCDLPGGMSPADEDRLRQQCALAPLVHCSALTGEGVQALRQELERVIFEGRLDATAADCLFNARQRDAVRRATRHVEQARHAVEQNMGYEFAALDLREATAALGAITGHVSAQNVLSRIFSHFCIGK